MNLCDDIIISRNRAIAKSYAKVNLTLDVLGKLENGYHEVRMVMQPLNLFDLITVKKAPTGIIIKTNIPGLPCDNKNIAYKAAELFFTETGIRGGVSINIKKNIPIAAGLAGGSGNAAAVLCSLNLLYNADLTEERLLEMGLKLGADVPYCIKNVTSLAEGIGERLTTLSQIPGVPVVLVTPPIGISTGEIYKRIDSAENLASIDTDGMISAIKDVDIKKVGEKLLNVMEIVTIKDCPEIAYSKAKMLEFGALGSVMSGSGPSVFGIFPDNKSAKAAVDYFGMKYENSFLTHTI